MKRKSVRRRVSKRVFKKTVNRIHKKNFARPMRGGYRL